MSKIDMDKLAQIVVDQKVSRDEKLINNDLHELIILFNEKCQKNKKYTKLNNLYKELQDLIYQNDKKLYFGITNVTKDELGKNDVYHTEFDEKAFLTAKNLSENWNSIKEKEEQKIKDIKNKVIFFKNSKLKKAQDNLEYMQQQVDKYNKYLSREQRKEEILRTYGTEENINHILKAARKEMARQTIEEHIMEFPNVIGKRYKHFSNSMVCHLYNLEDEIEEASNKLRKTVIDYMVDIKNRDLEKINEKSFLL